MAGIGSAMASPSRVMTGSPARLAHPGETTIEDRENVFAAFRPGTRSRTRKRMSAAPIGDQIGNEIPFRGWVELTGFPLARLSRLLV
jgi:hypothetical protein